MAGNPVEMDDPMDGDLRARVVQLEQASAASRLTALESWRQHSDVSDARKEEQAKAVTKRFDDLDKKIDEQGKQIAGVNGNLVWVVRLIIGGIIAAVLAFMFKGGFNVPL